MFRFLGIFSIHRKVYHLYNTHILIIVQVVQSVQIDLPKVRFTELAMGSHLAFVLKSIAQNVKKMQKTINSHLKKNNIIKYLHHFFWDSVYILTK